MQPAAAAAAACVPALQSAGQWSRAVQDTAPCTVMLHAEYETCNCPGLPPLSEADSSSTELSSATEPALRPENHAFQLRRLRQRYLADVAACLAELHEGNSYELCLTNAFERAGGPHIDSLQLYSSLRRINPAPHAAYLSFAGSAPLAVCAPCALHVVGTGLLYALPVFQ